VGRCGRAKWEIGLQNYSEGSSSAFEGAAGNAKANPDPAKRRSASHERNPGSYFVGLNSDVLGDVTVLEMPQGAMNSAVSEALCRFIAKTLAFPWKGTASSRAKKVALCDRLQPLWRRVERESRISR
jgi:hypothetical protein